MCVYITCRVFVKILLLVLSATCGLWCTGNLNQMIVSLASIEIAQSRSANALSLAHIFVKDDIWFTLQIREQFLYIRQPDFTSLNVRQDLVQTFHHDHLINRNVHNFKLNDFNRMKSKMARDRETTSAPVD